MKFQFNLMLRCRTSIQVTVLLVFMFVLGPTGWTSETYAQDSLGDHVPSEPGQNENDELVQDDHTLDDYVLAEQARKRNEPPFVVNQFQRAAVGPAHVVGQWGPVKTWPFVFASAANLPDGRIAVWGGNNRSSFNGGQFTYTGIWNPTNDQITEIGYNQHSMFCAIPTLRENGEVFVVGGDGSTRNRTSQFDFRTDSWSHIDTANTGRWYNGSLQLPNGQVFMALGSNGSRYPELWTEGEGWRWLNGIDLQGPILSHTSYGSENWFPQFTLTPNGRVLHVGPTPQMHYIDTAGNGSITQAGVGITGWDAHNQNGHTIVFDKGKLLTLGGRPGQNKATIVDFNGTAPQVTNIPNMITPRSFANSVMLPTGEVFTVGGNTSGTGFSDSGTVLSPEIWNPETRTWREVANHAIPRNYHSVALLMTDGRVFSGGGGLCGCSADHPDHQIYSPPYLFDSSGSLATRPTISSAPESTRYGSTIDVEASSGVQRFTMIKMSGTTHAYNTDQRFLEVDFTGSNGQYQLVLEDNINVLTPGYWMLFALNGQDVPSVSKIIQITSDRSGDEINVALGKPTSQSSTAIGGTSDRAVDGNKNSNWNAGTTTHTNNETNAWWQVDLESSNQIGEIKLWNRTDCCSDRLSNFYIFVSETDLTGRTFNNILNDSSVWRRHIPGQAPNVLDLLMSAKGRYVRIQLAGANPLSLSEVEVYPSSGNIAFGKTATQSSLEAGGVPSRAVDGNKDSNYPAGSTTHTATQSNAWWQVDLESSLQIGEIKLWNRTDCCSARLSNFYVFVSETDLTGRSFNNILNDGSVWRSHIPGQSPDVLDLGMSAKGRYVRVQLAGTDVLSLTEVEVYPGEVIERVAQWQMDEAGWTGATNEVQDSSGNNRHGTPGGGVSLSSTSPAIGGNPGSCSYADLNGVGHKITVPFHSGLNPDNFTVAFWTKVTGGSGTWRAPITSRWENGEAGQRRGFNVYAGTNDRWQFWTGTGEASWDVLTGPAVEDNSWTHVAISFQTVSTNGLIRTGLKTMYIDGVQVAQKTGVYRPNTLAPLYIGAGANGNSVFFNGDIDQMTMFNGALDLAGVQQLMNETHLCTNLNQAPTVNPLGDQNSPKGHALSVQVNASDPDGDDLTFGASGLPSGLSIDDSAGLISGSPSATGTHEVTVTVDDGNEGSDSISFTWVVYNELALNSIMAGPEQMGSSVSFTASFTGGSNPRFKWLFGDGTVETSYSSNPTVDHTYSQPGRYAVTLTATDDSGRELAERFTQLIYRPLTAQRPSVSMSIAYESRSGHDRVWNVNPDNDTVTVSNAVTRQKIGEIVVGDNPNALAIAPDGRIWVTNKDDATISIIDEDSLTVVQTVGLAGGSQPHGVVFAPNGNNAYVALEATGTLVRLNPANGDQTGSVLVGKNPRHLSILADSSQIFVSRFITPPIPGEETGNPDMNSAGGEVVVVSSSLAVVETIKLGHSTIGDTDTGGRGIPNYLGPAAISPDGLSAWVSSKQDNIARGTLRDGNNLDFQNSVRSVSSFINLNNNQEDIGKRIDYNNGGIANTAIFGRYGAFLFVSLEGSREVAVVDSFTNSELFRIDVGLAPQGLTVSADGETLFVHNFLGRSVSVFDISQLLTTDQNVATALSTIDVVANEQLASQVLRGKELFYDAKDTRLARDNYISCSSCHNAGDSDGRVWDLTSMGEGVRNTISLQGHANQGPLHWTANFDEVHDFEQQIRDLAGGSGLMGDEDFNARQDPLGPQKAGLSVDLDALAAYVNSLESVPNSPHRAADGGLTVAGEAGKLVFEAQGCVSCHSGAEFTDSAPDVRHDIGTLSSASGQRLGGPIDGLDTPTLRGLWMTAPYLHDGSAATLAEAINAHDGVSLSGVDLDNLVTYLNQIDEREPAPVVPPTNQDPILTNPGDQESSVGETIRLSLTSFDPDGDDLIFSSSGLPAGLTLSQSGLIEGEVSEIGLSSVSVMIDDGNDGSDTVEFNWVVTEYVAPPATPLGRVNWEYWNTDWGTTLTTLFNDADYPDNPADTGFLSTFEAPFDRADIFGQRIRGFLYPPVSGEYTFWISSDDQGELWLSPNDRPGNRVSIAQAPDWTFAREWNKYPEQQSIAISLEAGQVYYIEALAQEGGGQDHLAVAWQMAGGSREIISGDYLSPFDLDGLVIEPENLPPSLSNPGDQTNEVGDEVDLQLVATDPDEDTLLFSSPGLPAGLTLDSNTGRITGTLLDPITLNVNITVDDGNGGSITVSFLWRVDEPSAPEATPTPTPVPGVTSTPTPTPVPGATSTPTHTPMPEGTPTPILTPTPTAPAPVVPNSEHHIWLPVITGGG